LLTKVRTLIHEEISLLTVLYFPFRAVTPNTTLEALAEGVPLVALPVTIDQPGVAARIRAKGVGGLSCCLGDF
jgi:hypothetical protein